MRIVRERDHPVTINSLREFCDTPPQLPLTHKRRYDKIEGKESGGGKCGNIVNTIE